MRKFVLALTVVGSLAGASSAQAAIPSVLGGAISCSVASDGVRECGSSSPRSTAPTWDGTPIDVNVALPPDPSPSADGDYPLIIVGHGYGGAKFPFGAPGSSSDLRRFTSRGYAVFSMTDRGFHESCGTDAAISAAAGACDAAGWVHLMDDRFEVRDAQFLVGELADEGLVDGQRVGAIGGSYGGGLSLQLAALRDRTMIPNGSLVPWTSPASHLPMRIAAAAPIVPWSDLAYSLTPNGGTLDYVADSPYLGRIGIEKLSLVTGLYLTGRATGKYCGQSPYPSPCADPDSDLTAWNSRLNAGEPYDGDPSVTSIFDEITAHHSGYYIDHSVAPAPLLIANGFTDDLFPADEAIRFYNRTKAQYPAVPVSMLFGDFGHPRAATPTDKPADTAALDDATDAWLDHYVKGVGPVPFQGVTAFGMTCPVSAPSDGPFESATWAGFRHGEVRLLDPSAKTISATGGSPAVDRTWDPVTAGQDPCTSASDADLNGVATYRLPAATGPGYTLMGSPTVIASIDSPVANSSLAARLLDVAPDGTETLVDRQLVRPKTGAARQVFQLHPSGHLFEQGHVAKLELLPRDAGGTNLNSYGRPADGQGDVTVSRLDFRIPVMESPGSGGGQVVAPLPLAVPCGSALAPDFAAAEALKAQLGEGMVRRKGRRKLRVPVDSAPGLNPCRVRVDLLSVGKAKKRHSKRGKKRPSKKHRKGEGLGRGTATIAGGQSHKVKVRLNKRGRRAVRHHRRFRLMVTTEDAAGNTVQISKVKLPKRKHGHKGRASA
jgi:predicted acyl esterase